MSSGLGGKTVIFREQVDQPLIVRSFTIEPQLHLKRLCAEIVQYHDGVIAPLVAHRKHLRGLHAEEFEISPADLRHFLAHADHAFHPVEQRIRIAALSGDIQVLKSIPPTADDWHSGFRAFCEAALRFCRPLHWSAGALTLGQTQVVSHPDFIAIANHGCARKREHQAISKLKPAPVALQHGSESTTNAAVIKLHLFVRTECIENGLPLRGGESAEIEFIVIAQEVAPLSGRRT